MVQPFIRKDVKGHPEFKRFPFSGKLQKSINDLSSLPGGRSIIRKPPSEKMSTKSCIVKCCDGSS